MYKRILSQIWSATKGDHSKIILSAILIFTGAIINFNLKPLVLRELIDTAIAGESVLKFIIYFGILLIGINILFRVFDYLVIVTQPRMMINLYRRGLDSLLQHSYIFFTNTFSGSLIAKVKRYATSPTTIQDSFHHNILVPIAVVGTSTIVLFLTNWKLGGVFLLGTIIYTTITIQLTKKQRTYNVEEAKQESKTTGVLSDILTNVITVNMFGNQKKENKLFEKTTNQYWDRIKTSWHYDRKVWLFQGLALNFVEFMVMYVAIKMLQAGSITIGTVALVQVYAIGMFAVMWGVGKGIQRIVRSFSDMKELADIIDQPPDIVDKEVTTKKKIKRGEIEFKNVSFTYEENDVLKNFNLKINAGEKIGLVGVSGSGKSTLTKLLLRFVEPQKGEVLIDNIDISDLKQEDLRQAIAYVPQEPLLFHRTIAENIAYAKKTSQKELIAAAKKAHAHEFIQVLPKNYDTLVGERGVKLSGGERQRVAIARAIIKKSPILVMDEATSSVDNISEQKIKLALEAVMKNKTSIVIAHRLSTVVNMDRILVLDKGKVVEQGTHKQLLKKKGKYYKLYKLHELS